MSTVYFVVFRVQIPRQAYDALERAARLRLERTWTVEVREGVGASFGREPGVALSVHVHGVCADSALLARQRVAHRALHADDLAPLPPEVVELAEELRAVVATPAARTI